MRVVQLFHSKRKPWGTAAQQATQQHNRTEVNVTSQVAIAELINNELQLPSKFSTS